MAKRRFNWKLAIVIILGLGVLGVTAIGLHEYQRANRVEKSLAAGLEAYDHKKWKDAAISLGKYLARNQNDVDILLKYAHAQLNIQPLTRGAVQQATQAYRSALRNDPFNSEAVIRLIDLYLASGAPGEGELLAQRYLKDVPDPDPNVVQRFALTQVKLGKHEKAAALLKESVAIHPDHIASYEILGSLAMRYPGEFFRSSDEWFKLAVERNPQAAEAYLLRGLYYASQRQTEAALADLDKAAELKLKDAGSQLRLAATYAQLEQVDRAEEVLKKLADHDPQNVSLWNFWLHLAANSQTPEKVIEVADNALAALDTHVDEFLANAAEVFIRTKNYDRAEQCLKRLVDSESMKGVAAYLEGIMHHVQGKPQEAIESLQRALAAEYDMPALRVLLGQLFNVVGEPEEAVGEYEVAVELDPNNVTNRMHLARQYARLNYWDKAQSQARQVMILDSNNVSAAQLDINAQIWTASRDPLVSESTWHRIDNQLRVIEERFGAGPEIRRLNFQLAVARKDLDLAQKMMTDEPPEGTSEHQQWVAEKAALLSQQGKLDEAETLLFRGVDLYPQSAILARNLAVLYLEQDAREQCESLMRRTIEIMESVSNKLDFIRMLSALYMDWQQEAKAETLLTEMIKQYPRDIEMRSRLLQIESIHDNAQRSQSIIDEMRRIEGPDGQQWRLAQVRWWLNTGALEEKYSRIVSLLEENLVNDPGDISSWQLLAGAHHQKGELGAATGAYRKALDRAPNNLALVVSAADVFLETGRIVEAQELLDRMIQQHPAQLDLLRLQARSYILNNEIIPATAALEKLYVLEPNDVRVGVDLARMKIRQRQFDQAQSLIEALEKTHPTVDQVQDVKIQLLVDQGQHEAAIAICDRMLEDSQEHADYIRRATTNARIGNFEAAAGDYEKAIALDETNVPVRLAAAEFYRAAGRPEEAAIQVEAVLAREPANWLAQRLHLLLGLRSADDQRREQAREELDKAVEERVEDTELLMMQIGLSMEENSAPALDQALNRLRVVQERDPRNRQAWLTEARIHVMRGQSKTALESLRRGLAENPNDRQLLLMQAGLESSDSPAQAARTLLGLYQINPQDTEVLLQLAAVYIRIDQSQKAIQVLESHLKNCPEEDQHQCKIMIVAALYRKGDKDAAEKQFDAMRAQAPQDVQLIRTYVQLLIADENWPKVREVVHRWMASKPRTADVIDIATTMTGSGVSTSVDIVLGMLRSLKARTEDSYTVLGNLAMIEQLVGRFDEAIADYQLLLEREPQNVVAMNNLAWLYSEELGKYEEAYALTRRALELNPNYLDVKDTHGVVCWRLERFDEAEQHLLDCVKRYPGGKPESASSRFHLGRVCVKLGKKREAIKWLEEALEYNKRVSGLTAEDIAEIESLQKELSR